MTLHPYQQQMINKMKQYKGRGFVMTTGRQAGKSTLNATYGKLWNDLFGPTIDLIESSEVDDELWHTVRCQSHVGEWVRKQDPNMWYEHNTGSKFAIMHNKFDIHDKLYLMLQLKFS